MRRAFLSLYGLIVMSVIALGWGLDRLWNYYAPDVNVTQYHLELVDALTSVLDTDAVDLHQAVMTLRRNRDIDIQLFPLDAFAQSQLLSQIESGGPVEVRHARDLSSVYQLLPNHTQVMRIQVPEPHTNEPFFYDLLLVVFYGSLAVVVFLWTWPLSRDLAKLEKQTRILGKEAIPESLKIGPTSAIYDVALAFQRMSDRIQELIASHREMTYAVSHELRTPLARMKFALEIAGHQQTPDRMREKLDGLREDVSEMDALVTQLLTYAGFEQGEQNLDFQKGDLQGMINQLIDQVTRHSGKERPSIHIVSTATGMVNCEWCLMERAVHNLLVNALRFAHQRIEVSLGRDDHHVWVSVADDGPGIPEEDWHRVLNSFVRLTNHTNSQSRGFGLGLAIVQRVMKWHCGEVIIDRSHLGGASVTLRWPNSLPGGPS